MRGIYIHIPFCVRKCSYCDFYSVAESGQTVEGFAALLVREMDLFLAKFPAEAAVPADTVFFGGGTPTVLGPERLCRLLAALAERFPIAEGAEVSTEVNPGTVSGQDFRTLREGGFNRVSIGVQSFRPETLRTLGRIHGVDEVRAANEHARQAGFDSIGIDLIFGVPGQDLSDWQEDLKAALSLSPSHLSTYALAPEPGTAIHEALLRRELRMPADETVAEMYEEARRTLSLGGFRHYEISNFARPGSECRHNLKYWRREGYLGFGPSAHSLLFPPGRAPSGFRAANPPSLPDWTLRIGEGRVPWADVHVCDVEDAWKESLITGLRLTQGIDLAEIESRIGLPPDSVLSAIEELARAGKLGRDGAILRIPPEFLFVSNEVLQALV